MKPIRILILVAAVAAWAAAQNTTSSSQNTGSGTNGSTKSQTQAKTDSGSKSAHKTTSSNPASGVGLIVPKPTPKTASTKTSPATSSAGAKGASSTVPSKSAAQTSSAKTSIANNKSTGATATGTGSGSKSGPQVTSTKTSAANSKASGAVSTTSPGANTKSAGGVVATKTPGNKPVATQKTPELTVKPVQKPGTSGKTASANPSAKKSAASKAVSTPKNAKVKIVPQKTAKDGKTDNNKAIPTVTAAGRRDPFLSIIRSLPTTPAGPNCSVGKRCLFIPELELKGIARDPDGQMLAVVVSNTHRAYFLRENDQVFNGSVQKITGDSVVFREFATDHLGRETVHEVVKRIPKT